MPWIEVNDYRAGIGWGSAANTHGRSRNYCQQLEAGQILLFRQPPFPFPQEDWNYLISRPHSDSRLHKNISYRPQEDVMRGFGGSREEEKRVHDILRRYSSQVTQFVSGFLEPYAGKLGLDYASFRPQEEEDRDLPLHKRNDLLHVDAFPSRPTRGGRILRVFTNVNPARNRNWLVAERFSVLAERYARDAGLDALATSSPRRTVMHLLHSAGLPVADRSAYDQFMLRFHDWLKESSEFQTGCQKEHLEFPPMATWLVFTDGVPHAALSGQFAMEQTFIVPREALVSKEDAPIGILERLSGKKLA